MTNQEINLKIDEIKGYTGSRNLAIPNYITDWDYLGPLVVTMGYHGWVYYFDLLHKWEFSSVIIVEDHSFGKTTCLAYIKEFGNV